MRRVLSTIVLAAAVYWVIFRMGTANFQTLMFVVTGFGLWETGRLILPKNKELRLTQWFFGMAVAWFLLWGRGQDNWLPFVLVLGLFATFLVTMWKTDPLTEAVHRVALVLLGVVYIAMTLPYWGYLKEMGNGFVLLALLPASLTDTFAFLVGKSMGKRKFAPVLSPNKTWEGFAAALFGSFFGVYLANVYLENMLPALHPLGLALVIWIVAPLGDLAESLIKRAVGVKDSGNLIPGHGGVLDRLDALIFTAPFVYAYLKWMIV